MGGTDPQCCVSRPFSSTVPFDVASQACQRSQAVQCCPQMHFSGSIHCRHSLGTGRAPSMGDGVQSSNLVLRHSLMVPRLLERLLMEKAAMQPGKSLTPPPPKKERKKKRKKQRKRRKTMLRSRRGKQGRTTGWEKNRRAGKK